MEEQLLDLFNETPKESSPSVTMEVRSTDEQLAMHHLLDDTMPSLRDPPTPRSVAWVAMPIISVPGA